MTTTHNRSGVLRLAFGATIGASIVAGALTPAASAADTSSIKAAIRYCESSGNYAAQNPTSTASGAYQFLDTTWHGLGYSGRAKDAPAAQQDAAFDKLYASQGTSPWVSSQPCWGPKIASGNIPTTTSNTKGSSTSSTPTVSRSEVRRALTTSAATVTMTSSSARSAVPAARASSSVPSTTSASDLAMLNDKQKAEVVALTKVQQQQPTWSKDAAAGKTVTRTTAKISRNITTHSAPSFGKSTTSIKPGTSVTGQYVNIDWFKITSGPNAGQYISSGLLTTGNVSNGHLDAKSLAQIPDELRQGKTAINTTANLSLVKSLIEMNAHYAHDNSGANLKETDGYADFGQQAALFKRFGAPSVAPAGKSDHGLGLSMNFVTHKGDKANTWLNAHAGDHGFTAHTKYDSLFVFTG